VEIFFAGLVDLPLCGFFANLIIASVASAGGKWGFSWGYIIRSRIFYRGIISWANDGGGAILGKGMNEREDEYLRWE
jgi:hypothetical protein